jgi:hypothetical protein
VVAGSSGAVVRLVQFWNMYEQAEASIVVADVPMEEGPVTRFVQLANI